MHGIAYHRYGPPEVLGWEPLPDPQPGPDDVLVRIHAAALNPKDVLVRKGKFRRVTGARFPRVPGYDFAGVVQAVGRGVDSHQVGDHVFGMIQRWDAGACAELAAVPQSQLASKPPSLCMTDAASVPLVALTALQALRDLARVSDGDEVCLNGASGGLGTMAIQVARALGGRVTAVCSARNQGLVEALGADDVVDYTTADIRAVAARFDVFFDIFGSQPFKAVRHLLKGGGCFVTAIPRPRSIAREVRARLLGRRFGGEARLVLVRSRKADLETVARWLEDGTVQPVVDRVFPIRDSVAAHAYLETRRARGKVVLSLDA